MELRVERWMVSLSDTDLSTAVELLARYSPETLFPNAWNTLMSEIASRDRGGEARDIEMWSGVIDTLPSEVQDFLVNHARAVRREAA